MFTIVFYIFQIFENRDVIRIEAVNPFPFEFMEIKSTQVY